MNDKKSSPLIDDAQIRHLAELLHETGLAELEVEVDDTRLRLRRESAPVVAAVAPAPVAAAPAAPAEKTSSLENALKAPLVGTFYHSPAPDADPFIKVGDKVKQGQVVGIIEAMKTMNNVEADRSGTVTQLLTGDAEPVEFGQALMLIE